MLNWNKNEIHNNIINLTKHNSLLSIQTLKSYEKILQKIKEEDNYSNEYTMSKTQLKSEKEKLKQQQERFPIFFDKKIIFLQNNTKNIRYLNTKEQIEIIKSKNQILDIIDQLLNTINEEYGKIFENLINSNSIYLKYSLLDNSTFTLNDEINNKTYIYSTYNNTIKDIYKLLHEVFHAIQNEKKDYKENEITELVNETIPIISSFLLTDFLNNYSEEKYKEKNELLKNIVIFSKINNKKLELLNKNETIQTSLDVINTDYLENTKYIFSYFLAFELYNHCLKESSYKKITEFINNSITSFEDLENYDMDFFDIGSEKAKKKIKIYTKSI